VSNQPPPEVTMPELLDWLDDRLTPERRRAVEEAIETGEPDILELVTWYHTFRTDAARLPLVAPPPLLSQRLRALAAARRGGLPPLVRLFAHPVLDTRKRPRLVGVRGSDATDAGRYQITFAAPAVIVVLDVVPDGPSTVTIRGQVIPELETPPVFEASARGAHGVVTTILGDELGGFRLTGIPVEAESLVVTNDMVEVEMALSLSPGLE
jgi:hypothetical protein